MWGDVELRYDSELNSRYLEYNERQTKTRNGIDINKHQAGEAKDVRNWR